MDRALADLFLEHSATKLEQMTAAIEKCLTELDEEQIWHRGSGAENAVGNLILHLCGNVRQWIGHGVGGAADIRVREQEFAADGGMRKPELLAKLREVVDSAIPVIRSVEPGRLVERIAPQGRETSVLEAIYQVVGHFQQHTGQIVFITKQFARKDLNIQSPPRSK